MRATQAIVPWLALSAAAFAQTKPAKPPERTVEPRKWEHETSDLAPDPKMNFGALKNGFRYAWVNSGNPKKELYLRLHVNVGSLVETEQELGMAHFVEHMAFNGTANFKAGSLVESFNKQGIKFGSDINAHTSMEETVYDLDLPDAEPERLKKSLLWFRDIACGLKMEEKEVQAEKGVIDSEQRDRDSAGFRNFVSLLANVLDGTLTPKRLPIGIQSVRAKFNQKVCLGFYRRWYRPEHLTFVLAGDLGELDPVPLLEQTFGTIPIPKDPLPPRPDLGRPSFAKKGFAIEEAGADQGTITVARVRPRPERPDNAATRAGEVPLDIAHIIANARFDKRREQEKLPYLNVGSQQFDFENLVAGPAISVRCGKDQWKDALMAAERELRRIVERGFAADELKKAWVHFDRTLVPRPMFPPPHSLEYVQEILQACNERYVPMEDKAAKEAVKPGGRGLTAEAVSKAFKEAWSQGELVIFTQGGIDLGADPAADLIEIWNAAKATDLDQPLPARTDTTAKADPPKEGGDDPTKKPEEKKPEEKKPEEKKVDPRSFAYAMPDVVNDPTATIHRMNDLRAVDLKFKNGVTASYKKPVEARDFPFGRWEVRVGEGMLSLEPTQRELAWVADNVFLLCGLGKNDWATVQAAGGGVSFSVDGDACVFSGAMFGGDLKRPFEAICAYLTDPGWRADAFDEWKKKLPDQFKPDDGKENLGSLLGKFDQQLLNGERRLLPPDRAAAEAVTLDQVKGFLKSQLDGPIEITAVGIDALKFEKALFSTFAKLPPRRAAQPHEERRAIAPPKTGLKERHEVDTGEASALIHLVYPATDRLDAATGRKLDLLEDVVMDRLRIEIREKRGGAYSPRASVSGSDTWKGLGWVTLDVRVDPAKVDEMTKACALTMESLGAKGVTQQELDRLRIAHLGDVDTALKDDGLWFDALKAAHRRPQIFDELRNLKATYDKITVADLNALCKQLFVKGRENVFVAVPKK